VGLPLPGVSVRPLDSSGKPVPDGETGEIYLRGPNVFEGYWRREDATCSVFVDGFFRTGDLATRSADGYYTLCGRKSTISGPARPLSGFGEKPSSAKPVGRTQND
jgi:acyl-CoA synthetase (AMP-forming)/AMP-acid ligase II